VLKRGFRTAAVGLVALAPIMAASNASANIPTRPAVAVGRVAAPSVFGSTAISIGRTPMDGKWRAVSSNMRIPASWAAERQRLSGLDGLDQLIAVNTWVNRNVRDDTDSRAYGVNDHWATAAETAAKGRGDCEDFAIAKMALLRAAGVAESDLYLSIVKDVVLRADHAVLLVRVNRVLYVLDSHSDQVLATTGVADYRPIITLNMAGAWVHGYPVNSRQIQLATTGR
jgi:predicted transglutaminase-like cysteine proteinase